MSELTKAVFLSYASQDAAVAKEICDALRAAGVEVWFDQSELRGGDAWDQKIKRQIKECALFMPVISAHTQARAEGYFRLEWKLAVDRSHLMADDAPFLFPVLIDEIADAAARVPDRFREVQWTHLGAKATPEKLAARVVKLLAGKTEPERPRDGERGAVPPARQPDRASPWLRNVAVIGGVLIGIVYALRPHEWLKPKADAAARPPVAQPAPAAAWPRDPNLKRAMDLVNGTEANSEDFALAEELAKGALAQRPTDPEAVTVMARVQVAFLFRGFDRSDERRAGARRYAERAVQLAPDHPEALAALGVFFIQRSADLARARELLDRAIALKPTEPFFHRHRDNALFIDPKVPAADALASAEKTAALFPGDALAHYELARHYRDTGRIAEMERELDRTIAIAPIANAIVWKARIALWVRSDPEEMRVLIERVPSRVRSVERVVFSRWVYAVAVGRPDDGLNALQNLTSGWIEDFDYVGPKALLVAQLLELQGKRELARLQFEAALAEVRARQARTPGNSTLRTLEVWIMHGLGRDEEARAANRTALETIRRPYRYGKLSDWWFTAIPACLLIGERDTALQLVREAVAPAGGNDRLGGAEGADGGPASAAENAAEARAALRLRFKFDPRMAPFRADPAIAALVAEPITEEKKTTAPLTEAGKLTARALTLYSKLNYTREDLAVADELTRKATELEAGSATAWGARAGVQATYIYRNWDPSEKRRQDTQAFANRALGLNPDEPEALLALGHLMNRQGVVAQAVDHFRRALAADPANNRAARALATTLSFSGRQEEGRAILLAAVRRDPRDPLVRYDLALTYDIYVSRGRWPENLPMVFEHLDAGLAAQPVATLLLAKAVAQGGWLDDLPAMRTTLDQLARLPLAERAEDRAVFVAMWGGLLERDAARVLEAATLTAKNYFEDSVVPRRSMEWSLALAHRLQHKENLARLDWQRAEQLAQARLRDQPGNQFTAIEIAIALAWLGRTDEAAREVATIEAAWREELLPPRARMLALYYAALGDAAKAAPYLRAGLNTQVFLTTKTVPRDPWFDKLRGQPEFEALLKAPPAK